MQNMCNENFFHLNSNCLFTIIVSLLENHWWMKKLSNDKWKYCYWLACLLSQFRRIIRKELSFETLTTGKVNFRIPRCAPTRTSRECFHSASLSPKSCWTPREEVSCGICAIFWLDQDKDTPSTFYEFWDRFLEEFYPK